MLYVGIDPGPRESGVVVWHKCPKASEILYRKVTENEWVVGACLLGDGLDVPRRCCPEGKAVVVIEEIVLYQRVSMDVRDTLIWTGRFVEGIERFRRETDPAPVFIPVSQINRHLCPGVRSPGDSGIRAALIDRLGPPGTKKNPNPITYGLKSHLWRALALIVVEMDRDQSLSMGFR